MALQLHDGRLQIGGASHALKLRWIRRKRRNNAKEELGLTSGRLFRAAAEPRKGDSRQSSIFIYVSLGVSIHSSYSRRSSFFQSCVLPLPPFHFIHFSNNLRKPLKIFHTKTRCFLFFFKSFIQLTDSSSALSRFVYATMSFLLRLGSCASITLLLGRFVAILFKKIYLNVSERLFSRKNKCQGCQLAEK